MSFPRELEERWNLLGEVIDGAGILAAVLEEKAALTEAGMALDREAIEAERRLAEILRKLQALGEAD